MDKSQGERAPLEERAVALAQACREIRRGDGRGLLRSFAHLEQTFGDIESRLADAKAQGVDLGRAAEWLLDNAYLVAEALHQVTEGIPPRFYRQLPKIVGTTGPAASRVYALARDQVSKADVLDIGRVAQFIETFQTVTPLTMGELWAFPMMLRFVLLQDLSDVASRVAFTRKTMTQPALAQAGREIGVYVTGLRMIAAFDWKAFFEAASLTERALRNDPARLYKRMDFQTRDQYRKGVEALARHAKVNEEQVARAAVAVSKSVQEDIRESHVGHYLVGDGRDRLFRELACSAPFSLRISRMIRKHATALYLTGVTVIAIVLLLTPLAYASSHGASPFQLVVLALVAMIPALSLAVSGVHWLITHVTKPRVLFKMDFADGIPSEYRSIVVVPALLTSPAEVRDLLRKLEVSYHGNRSDNLAFALLTDFADAPSASMPGDDELLEQAISGITLLNEQNDNGEGGPFFLFHRERLWNESMGCWMGWERKRGKLAEFNRLVLGTGDTSYHVKVGNLSALTGLRYAVTLDADTGLPHAAAARLIATLAHPLNHAQFDEHGRVTSGYTVLQPRIEMTPGSASSSLFAVLFHGDTGLDLYTRAVSDVYQDFFGEGIYAGKGVYDIAAFERSLAGRIPENALLSHDLFEGVYGRAALASDLALFEEYPDHVLAFTRRMHRWIRGDWQLLPWLGRVVPSADGPTKNRLSLLSRWKIFDNLRRSLVAPSVLILITVAWLWMPGSPMVWALFALGVIAIPVLLSAASTATRLATGAAWSSTLKGAAWSFPTQLFRFVFAVVLLPYESLVVTDAVARTLHRLYVSRRLLLKWTSAAHTARALSDRNSPWVFWSDMFGGWLLGLAISAVVWVFNRSALPVAAPALALWLLSPQLAWVLSRPRVEREATLPLRDRRALRLLARRTWHYFERFVGPADHWLAPDNFQEEPLATVARRTSPTNQGLALLAPVAAYDFGYTGTLALAATLRNMVDGMTGLERYRGHFLNWYETVSRTPLLPRYVSTVDSGNLAACLIVLRQAHRTILRTPLTRHVERQGLIDTVDVLVDLLRRIPRNNRGKRLDHLIEHLIELGAPVRQCGPQPGAWRALLEELKGAWLQRFNTLVAELLEEDGELGIEVLKDLRAWADRVRYAISSPLRELNVLQPWIPLLEQPPALYRDADGDVARAWAGLVDCLHGAPTLRGLVLTCTRAHGLVADIDAHLAAAAASDSAAIHEARQWNAQLSEALDLARQNGQQLLGDLHTVSTFAAETVDEMDFGFLFDTQRQLFRIGYNVSAGEFDTSYYDLLASEARIASIVAIAKRDVPVSHWLHLRRPFGRVGRKRVLLSWSGTMFEFLMPDLFASAPKDSVLGRTSVAAVGRQMTFAESHDVPWGISESGFYQLDAHANYQYRAFGVPGLGLRLELGDRIVISPYASVLALSVEPVEVVTNLKRLAGLGMFGQYGLFEAIDYGPPSGHPLRNGTIVRSYMTHHQGMIFQSLNNFLNGNLMVRRFHNDPRIASTELVLFEQAPRHVPVERRLLPEQRTQQPVRPPVAIEEWLVPLRSPVPQVHALSNRRVSVLLTARGGGQTRWRKVALTRWRPQPSEDTWGTWMYLRDLDTGAVWSVGYEPTRVEPDAYEVHFAPHMVEYSRHDHGIAIRMNVTVPPSDDVEIRRVTIVNDSDRPRHLVLTSYGEVVLGDDAQDRRHQAFNKLFVQSGQTANNVLVYERRRRAADEKPLFLAHGVTVHDVRKVEISGECDREAFLGHAGARRAPAGIHDTGARLSVAKGATLDPIFSLSCKIEIDPNAEVMLVFVTSVGRARSEVLAAQDSYRSLTRVDWAFDQSRSHAEFELHELGLQTDDVRLFQEVLSALLYPYHGQRSPITTLAGDWGSRSHLWAHGISGDHPILLVHVGQSDELDVVHKVLKARRYWLRRHLRADIVIVDEESTVYLQPLHERLEKAIVDSGIDPSSAHDGVYLLSAAQLDAADRAVLEHAAHVVLNTGKGSLESQLRQLQHAPHTLPRFVPVPSLPPASEAAVAVERPTDLQFANGLGGFSPDGREYVIHLEAGEHTPAPWINVIANPHFGFLVSESGGGYSWAENSGENRLTSWHNDPVSDDPSEVLYVRDEETAKVWSPTPKPAGDDTAYQIRHGAGYTEFHHASNGLEQRMVVFAAKDEPVKLVRLTVRNLRHRARRLTATYFADWVLGTSREATAPHIVTEYDGESGALLARNPFHDTYGTRIAFLAGSRMPHGFTSDRAEFMGQESDLARPPGLDRIGLTGASGGGLNPCAALQLHVDLPADGQAEVHFMIGQGRDRDQVTRLVEAYRPAAAVESALDEVRAAWAERLGALSVSTPDPAMDVMLNGWLLYQTVTCRLWGRSGLYQSSGAFGFRDQLQDVMALVTTWPDAARAHILEAARHQFIEGDVLHWWHPETDQGVRTRCSDDLVWLPYVTAHYVAATGDDSILSEEVSFLQGPPLGATEHERFGAFDVAHETGSLYEHCLRAFEQAITAGPRQLPLIGTCDWNDGFSRVGIEGRGESIWLAWFLHAALMKFAPLCERQNELDQAQRFRDQADFLRRAVEAEGWDGEWYRRAYYDDGEPIGSAQSDEAQIDSIAQSWSVLSGAGDSARVRQAMASALDRLVRRDERLILLLTPPFDSTDRDPGYIKGYPPGVRENGGQYTHAAIWLAWAAAQLGDGDEAHALFRLLNPIHHGDDPAAALRYRVEPYVVAADVYSEPPHTGRGGWTWYTGSAAWLYRLGVEGLLGVRKVNDAVEIDPCIPKTWSGFQAILRRGRAEYRITVENPERVNRGVSGIVLDGRAIAVDPVPLVDDGRVHEIVVRLGKRGVSEPRGDDDPSERRAVQTGAQVREQ